LKPPVHIHLKSAGHVFFYSVFLQAQEDLISLRKEARNTRRDAARKAEGQIDKKGLKEELEKTQKQSLDLEKEVEAAKKELEDKMEEAFKAEERQGEEEVSVSQ